MTKFPLFIKTAQNIKHPPTPPIMPLATYEEAVGYERIKDGYKQALRGQRKYTREAVKYDLFREKNNVDLWRELKSSKYTPGPYHFAVITEPKRRDLSIPKLRDKVVQLVIHEELQNMFRPVFINAFDASPAWEDITAQVAINRVYNFLNQSKTAEKWGVNVRFTIEKNEGYEGEVSISGFGGAYE